MRIAYAITAVVISFSAFSAQAAVDVVAAPTGYFVPTDAQRVQAPYYRGHGQDWGWTHGVIAPGFTTAALNISAYDVDTDGNGGTLPGEVDNIYAMDNGNWVLLGSLQGFGNVWEFTTFDLTSNFFDDISNGLEVMIEIDVGNVGWFVTLAKSTLTTDGADPGNPNPGVPEPATWAMLIAGFGLIGAAMRRRRTNSVHA